ncbi:hypothetical protein CMI41_01080 [Candidatus Pacearchaeota archaeon]|nr:hypothetical protein [Candidatus Pacearchaeota archaeon]|tara:strand:- start:4796 stop:5245 length:450 start_codon:yes stop_codon:yes gene_type:complete
MSKNEEEIYIPRRKIKKNFYLELKKVNEEYESILDIWGSSDGSDQKVRKIKARELMKTNPDLSLFRSVLTTQPSAEEDEVCEGLRYWMMKENGTLPVKKKIAPLPIVNPIAEELVLTEEIVIQTAKEDKPTGKKQKVTFGNKVAKFFGF